MAEALLRYDAGGRFIESAGTKPAAAGSEAERLAVFRRVRDEIREYLRLFPDPA